MNEPSVLIAPEKNERVQTYRPPKLSTNDSSAIMQIIERMTRESKFDPVAIREMLAIKKEYEADEARKAYSVAMAAFKENAPVFHKTKHVDYGTGKPKFDYAPLAEVVSKIVPPLAAHGVTHNWIPKVSEGLVSVKCVLTHRLGHSDSVESPLVPPGTNTALSPSQNMQATITFWQRMTLQWITGTAAGDVPDVDDHGGDDETQYIGEGQIHSIKALLSEVGGTEESFLRLIKADAIHKIHVGAYQTVVGILEAKRKHV